MADLPPKQAAVLAFIKRRLKAGWAFPGYREIANHMGWKNDSSAVDCLERLKWRGLLPGTETSDGQ
jgi:SOS-response transcriptional repressor LexA